MTESQTHVFSHNGTKYECIEVGSHPHAHGEEKGVETSGEIYGVYRCFECGKKVEADSLPEAKEKLRDLDCN